MIKFGDKVIIRDGSRLDGVEGIVYRVDADRVSILLDREVIWYVDPADIEPVPSDLPGQLPVI